MTPSADVSQPVQLHLILLDSHGRPHIVLEPPAPDGPGTDGNGARPETA